MAKIKAAVQTSSGNTTVSTLTVSLPPSTKRAQNDMMAMAVWLDGGSVTSLACSGWTLHASGTPGSHYGLFVKVHGASESNPVITWTTARAVSATLFVFEGAVQNVSTVIGAYSAVTAVNETAVTGASGRISNSTGLTTTANEQLIIGVTANTTQYVGFVQHTLRYATALLSPAKTEAASSAYWTYLQTAGAAPALKLSSYQNSTTPHVLWFSIVDANVSAPTRPAYICPNSTNISLLHDLWDNNGAFGASHEDLGTTHRNAGGTLAVGTKWFDKSHRPGGDAAASLTVAHTAVEATSANVIDYTSIASAIPFDKVVVEYDNNGLTSIGGLTHGSKYVLGVTSTNGFSLYAGGTTAVTITSTGGAGNHIFHILGFVPLGTVELDSTAFAWPYPNGAYETYAMRRDVGGANNWWGAQNAYGFVFEWATDQDFRNKVIGVSVGPQASIDWTFLAAIADRGVQFILIDKANKQCVWTIGGVDMTEKFGTYPLAVVDVSNTNSEAVYVESGFDPQYITACTVLIRFDQGAGQDTSLYRQYTWGGLWDLTPGVTIAGGTASDPITGDDVRSLLFDTNMNVATKQGAAQAFYAIPIHFGDGTNEVHLNFDKYSNEFGASKDLSVNRVAYQGPNSACGITLYPTATSSIVLENSTLSSTRPFFVTIHSSASSSATWEFTGVTLAGAGTVSLYPYATYTSMTFAACSSIVTNGATANSFSNCSFIATTTRPDFSDDTLSGCSITSATGSTCCKIDLGTTLTNVNLIAGDSSSYGLEIAEAGTYNLETVSWTNFAAGKKVNITAGSGTFTLNAAGKLNTAAVNASGVTLIFDVVTTTIKHLTLTNGARYQLYNVTQATELANSTAGVSGFTYTTASAVAEGDTIRLRATYINGSTSWSDLEATGIVTLGGTLDFGANSLEADSTYAAYAINGSTVSEFSTDYVATDVDVSDADHQTTKKRLYAWLRYVQTTEDGIRNWWGAVTALDDANIRINGSVVDLEIENNGTQVCRFTDTDIYMYRDDGASIAAATGQGIIWESGKVYIAETGVSGLTASESNQLSQAAAAYTANSKIPATFAMNASGQVTVGSMTSGAAGTVVTTGDIDGKTLEEAIKLILSVAAGKSTKTGNDWAFRAIDDSKDRVTVTVSAGTAERTAVTVDASG